MCVCVSPRNTNTHTHTNTGSGADGNEVKFGCIKKTNKTNQTGLMNFACSKKSPLLQKSVVFQNSKGKKSRRTMSAGVGRSDGNIRASRSFDGARETAKLKLVIVGKNNQTEASVCPAQGARDPSEVKGQDRPHAR